MFDELIKIIISTLGVAFGTALTALVIQLLRKAGIDLSAEQRAKLETIAQQGILLVEEKAAAAAKAGIANISPGDKFRAATEHLVSKMPGVTKTEAAEIVMSELPKLGLGATDFAKAVLVKATTVAPVSAPLHIPPSMPEGEK